MSDYTSRKLHSAMIGAFIFNNTSEERFIKTSVSLYLTAQDSDDQYGPSVTVDVVFSYVGDETIDQLHNQAIERAQAILQQSSTFNVDAIKSKAREEEAIVGTDA